MIVLQNNSRLFRVLGTYLWLGMMEAMHARWCCCGNVTNMQPIGEQIPQIVGDDDTNEDGESDEGEGQKFNMDLGDFNMQKNLNFLFDEHEDLNYEIWRMGSVGKLL